MNALGRVLSHPICGPAYLIRSQNPNWVPRMVLFRPESSDSIRCGEAAGIKVDKEEVPPSAEAVWFACHLLFLSLDIRNPNI